jgi:hypothetical protein
MLIRDTLNDAAALGVEHSNAARGDRLNIDMRDGGGFMARFVPAASLAKERKA